MARPSVAPPASTRSAQRAGGSPAFDEGLSRASATESEWDALAFGDFADAPLFCRWIRGRGINLRNA